MRPHASLLLLLVFASPLAHAQRELGRPELDRSKPVPPKSDVVKAWQKRQDGVRTLRFAWTEQQTHSRGWIPNPRVHERERVAMPALFRDRTFPVAKTLTVDGRKMRYSLAIDRKAEPDDEGRHFSYVSVFDGQSGLTRLSDVAGDLPPVVTRTGRNVDAQTLDTRAILMAFRPLDSELGHVLVDRAVCNQSRFFYKQRSTMILEERREPFGWKTLMWLEPERDFIVTRYLVMFEQRVMIDIDIDYIQDARWGWVPNAWRVTEKLSDGTKHVLSTAKVTSYALNEPVAATQFQ
jgi:hypothetical protein